MRKSRFTDSQIMAILKQAGGWPIGSRTLPRAWHQQRNLLQVALQVWWHGHIHDEAS